MNNFFLSMVAVVIAGLIVMGLDVKGEVERFVVDGLTRVFEIAQHSR